MAALRLSHKLQLNILFLRSLLIALTLRVREDNSIDAVGRNACMVQDLMILPYAYRKAPWDYYSRRSGVLTVCISKII